MFGITRNKYGTITIVDIEYDGILIKRLRFNGCIKIGTLHYEVAKEFTEFTEVDIEDGIAFDTIDDCEINLGNNVTISVVVYDRHCSDEERAEKYPHTISEFEDAVIDACVEARIKRAVK